MWVAITQNAVRKQIGEALAKQVGSWLHAQKLFDFKF
jgi:hypothetical protein